MEVIGNKNSDKATILSLLKISLTDIKFKEKRMRPNDNNQLTLFF